VNSESGTPEAIGCLASITSSADTHSICNSSSISVRISLALTDKTVSPSSAPNSKGASFLEIDTLVIFSEAGKLSLPGKFSGAVVLAIAVGVSV